MGIQRLKEFDKVVPDEAEQIKLEDMLGVEVSLTGAKFLRGKMGEFVLVWGMREDNGKEFYFSTGAAIVIRLLTEVEKKDAFPVHAKFSKKQGERGMYYDVE